MGLLVKHGTDQICVQIRLAHRFDQAGIDACGTCCLDDGVVANRCQHDQTHACNCSIALDGAGQCQRVSAREAKINHCQIKRLPAGSGGFEQLDAVL